MDGKEPIPADDDTDCEDVKTYVTGAEHGVNVHFQLNDDNEFYLHCKDTWQETNGSSDASGHSSHPFELGRLNASWTLDNSYQSVGMFSSEMHYGCTNPDGTWTQYNSYHHNLYDDASKGSDGIANNPAKRKVIVHRRSNDLTYQDGNEFTWPPGWHSGQTYEGTAITVQASYADDINTVISDAFELLAAAYGKQTVKPFVRKCESETIRFDGLEVHHRFDRRMTDAAVETLRDSARLVATGNADGTEKGEIEKGHYKLWGFSSTNLEEIGFEDTIEYEYDLHGKTYTDEVDCKKHYLKVYQHQLADQLGRDHPLGNPKMEVKLYKAHPAPAWDAVVNHLHTVLNAHMDWAGIQQDDLVADDFYSPIREGQFGGRTIETAIPTTYKTRLKEYFKSDGLKKTVIGMLFNRRTMSAYDLMHLMVRESYNGRVSYDYLANRTGLSKSTIRKHVKKFEEECLVNRESHGRSGMFVRISAFAKKRLSTLLDKMRDHGSFLNELRERRKERETADSNGEQASTAGKHAEEDDDRAKDDSSTPEPATADSDPVESTWVPLSETDFSRQDMAWYLSDGVFELDDVALRRTS